MKDDFTDIINLPRYSLRHHRPMGEGSRAAQFSAFAALTGYDEEIGETARQTTARQTLCEDDLAALDAAFERLLASGSAAPLVAVRYFQPDSLKAGGTYQTYTGRFRFYDRAECRLKFMDGRSLVMQNICGIQFLES